MVVPGDHEIIQNSGEVLTIQKSIPVYSEFGGGGRVPTVEAG